METFAVYWEPVIKTYGIFDRTDLCLVSFQVNPDQMGEMGYCLSRCPESVNRAVMLVFARPARNGRLYNHILLATASVVPLLMDAMSADPEMMMDIKIDKHVELIYFQGPHFGDRYGIAEAALKALAARDVPLTATVCTGASVYLITPKGGSQSARAALAGVFMAP